MPTTNQQAPGSTAEYDTDEERLVAEKPKRVVLSIKPTTEGGARRLLGAANAHGDQEIIEHFAEEVRRLA